MALWPLRCLSRVWLPPRRLIAGNTKSREVGETKAISRQNVQWQMRLAVQLADRTAQS